MRKNLIKSRTQSLQVGRLKVISKHAANDHFPRYIFPGTLTRSEVQATHF